MKLIVCGNYGATNLGDEAILDGILLLLNRAEPNADITVFSANPDETSRLHNVKSVHHLPAGPRSALHGIIGGHIIKTLDALRAADGFILGGGGLFADEKMRAILIWSLQAKFASLMRKPLFCLGQSVGPLNTFFGRAMTKKVFSRALAVTVRDSSSQKLLHALGLPMPKTLADPAFALHNPEPHAERREDYVVFSFRPWIGGNSAVLYKYCAQFIDWLWRNYGLKSVLVPFQSLQDSDQAIMNNIFAHVEEKSAAHLYVFTPDYRSVLELIAKAKAVVGMRLHSLIFATQTETPFLALSYSDKVSSFVADLGLTDYLLPWESVDLPTLQSRFKLLMKNYDHAQSVLNEKNVLMRARVHEHEGLLKAYCKLLG